MFLVEMLKSTDYKHLTTKHYGSFSKLGFRKSYNDFAEPGVGWESEVVELVMENGAKKVLDVGCGNGDLLIKLRKKGFQGKLFGVDLSKGILSGGIERNRKERLGITFEVGDMQSLRFEDGFFDVVISKHMLYHVPNVQKGVDEMHRCLKPRGTLLITLNSKRNKPKLFKCEKIILEKFGLHTEHGQQLVGPENLEKYLKKFSKVETKIRSGKLNKPELFVPYFETFRNNYEPEPGKELWAKVLKYVKEFVERETEKNGEFIETCVTSLTKAVK